MLSQALEGKDVKDLLLNVGSGGGAAAAPTAGGAASGGGDAPAEEKKEEKEEGLSTAFVTRSIEGIRLLTHSQRKRNRTRIWVLVFSIRVGLLQLRCSCNNLDKV